MLDILINKFENYGLLPVHNFCPEAKLSMEGRALSQHLKTRNYPFLQLILLPDATRESARVWLKMLTSAFAAITLWTNMILAINMKKPTRKARNVAKPNTLFIISAI